MTDGRRKQLFRSPPEANRQPSWFFWTHRPDKVVWERLWSGRTPSRMVADWLHAAQVVNAEGFPNFRAHPIGRRGVSRVRGVFGHLRDRAERGRRCCGSWHGGHATLRTRVFGHKKVIHGSRAARSVEKIRTCNWELSGAQAESGKCYHWAKNELRKIKGFGACPRSRGLRRGLCVFLPHSPAIVLSPEKCVEYVRTTLLMR